jgi:hypothetical protein
MTGRFALRSAALGAASLLALLAAPFSARADAVSAGRCQRTINKELGKFVKTKSKIMQKCKEGVVKRGNPPLLGDCPTTDQDTRINAAAQKMRDKIAAHCGGKNKQCNVADAGANADEPLADIGWDIGTCPDLRGEGCINAINDCNDIGTCLTCIGHEAVNHATELYYDLLVASEFATGSDVNKCQVAIGKATVKFLQAKSKLLNRCWDNVLNGKDGFTVPPGCPATDLITAQKIAAAEQKKIATICTACGAGGDVNMDNLCDDPGQGISPTAIGFEPDCPDVTIPGSATSCGGLVTSLADLIACVDCVTEFEVDCSAAIAVPNLTPYPADCP